MKDTKKYKESRQLHKEGYSQESRVELDGNEKARSISMTSNKKQNGEDVYDSSLLEKILDKDNMNRAFKRVKGNRWSHGVDKITTEELLEYLKKHGDELRESILEGNYNPKPVRKVEIPKDNGKMRQLGIPTVVDRVIQQAIAQVLSPIFEEIFSEYSYGFRPSRGCHDALKKSKEYINDGYDWVVDIDLKAYFDTINHDKLIGLIYKEVKDIRVISLIRKYLQAGIMENADAEETQKGVMQGGNLSPLLSNIMLNELDKELTKRGLRFVRYADDCNIYVRSEKAANRVMGSITRYIEGKLKLTVNKEKSNVGRPWELKFLGYSFYRADGRVEFRVHEKSVEKLKQKIRYLTGRSKIGNIKAAYIKLRQLIVGWVNYFKLANMKTKMQELDAWLRRRIRMCYWKQWKRVRTKFVNLQKLGTSKDSAWKYANTRKGYWRIALSQILTTTITNARLKSSGLVSLAETYARVR